MSALAPALYTPPSSYYPRAHEPTKISSSHRRQRRLPRLSRNSFAADNPDLSAIQKEIEKRHDET